jgi:pimeloyl-ACP methyl ester carboxylesterase
VSHTPTIYTATDTDMLFPHLGRLPPLKPGQEIRRIDQGPHAKGALIAEGFARFGSPGAAPTDRDALASSATIGRQFRSASLGGQIHLRHAGEQTAPPLLLVHDSPGSSAQWEPLIRALSRYWFVIAPDMPGSGESDPLPSPAPSMRDFGDGIRDLLDELGIPATRVYGIGFGASVGLDLAHRFPGRVTSLALRALLVAEEGELRALAAAYTPPISIQDDGGHWYRAWLMLRDSLVWWPWYDRRVSALRRTAESFDARRLHRWTVDVMRRRETYGHLIQAALGHDARAALTALDIQPLWLSDPLTPLSVYEPFAFDLRPDMSRLTVDPDPEVHVRTLAASTDWRL